MGAEQDRKPDGEQTDGAPVLDPEQIDGLISAAGVEGAQDILQAFWRSTDNLIADLQKQLGERDWESASRTAHALKGSSLNVGAVGLSDSARAIEDACRENDVAAAQESLNSVQTFYSETVEAFAARFAAAA